MPLGALITRADAMNWPPGSHASTFGGNPVSCRAALATLDLLEREFMTNATERGTQLHAGLDRLAAAHSQLANPRGLGLMQAIDIVGPAGLDPQRRHDVILAAFQRGLLLLGCGKAGIRFCPALCVSAEQVDIALELFEQAITG
jgi:4-aminobutyrate aminotransferase